MGQGREVSTRDDLHVLPEAVMRNGPLELEREKPIVRGRHDVHRNRRPSLEVTGLLEHVLRLLAWTLRAVAKNILGYIVEEGSTCGRRSRVSTRHGRRRAPALRRLPCFPTMRPPSRGGAGSCGPGACTAAHREAMHAVGRSSLSGPPASRTPPVVLLADDNADVQEIYSQCLRHAGFRTVIATDGLDAYLKAVTTRPSVIFLDYMMPVVDGVGAARLLRADPRTCGIPIVVVSAYPSPAADGFGIPWLTKPQLPDDIVRTVRALLDNDVPEL